MAKEIGVARGPDDGFAKDEFDRLIEPTRLRTKRQANQLFLIFAGLGVLVAFVIGAVALVNATPDENTREDLLIMLSQFLFYSVIGIAVRQMILQDLVTLPRLRDRGSTFQGRIVRQRMGPSGMYHLRIAWDENGRPSAAFFDAIGLTPPFDKVVQVRALPRTSPVAVAINGRLYTAVRATYRP